MANGYQRLPTANNKCYLTVDQMRSGVVDAKELNQRIENGEITTSTGLVLEEREIIDGELWGRSDGGHDKFNEQVSFL